MKQQTINTTEITDALFASFNAGYAAAVLAMVQIGTWRFELDPDFDHVVGIRDRNTLAVVAVIYLAGHEYGVDVEISDAFEDSLEAEFVALVGGAYEPCDAAVGCSC
jgi:hypothetical protein